MGKYSKKKKATKQRKVLTIACVAASAVLVLLIVVLACLNQGKGPENVGPGANEDTMAGATSSVKELLVESVTEQGDAVIVVTTYGTVKYPYAFSDLISVEAETFADHAALDFLAEIEGEKHKLYTLTFHVEEGMVVGTLEIDGETYLVTAQFHGAAGLSDDSMVTFYAAQETFNDVVNSLSDNEGFTAED